MRYLWSLIFFTLSLFSFDYHLKSYTITNGVECFFGLSSQVNEINGGNIVNSCYIETDDGYVVIDSGPTYSYAKQAFQVIKEQKSLPVQYVINTSAEDVHVLGNGFYKEQGAKLIGPSYYKEYEQKSEIDLQKHVSKNTFTNTRIVPLDTYITGSLTITIGGVDFHILKAEKKSDRYLMIHIPSKEILFAGDMVFNNRIPPLKNNRSLQSWLNSLKEIEAIPWKRLISSHGIKTKYSALKNTNSYLKILYDEVQSCIQEKLTLEACQNRVKMYAFIEDRLYDVWHTHNVATAYKQLQNSKPNTLSSLEPIEESLKKIVKQDSSKEELSKAVIKKTPPLAPKAVEKKVSPPKPKPITREPNVTTYSYSNAIRKAKRDKKIVLLKIRSNNCPYCDELDSIIRSNNTVKRLINRDYIMVNKNISLEKLPLGIEVRLTPSLAFIRPDTQQVVMIIPGIEALGELIDILKEGAQDGRSNGYLK